MIRYIVVANTDKTMSEHPTASEARAYMRMIQEAPRYKYRGIDRSSLRMKTIDYK